MLLVLIWPLADASLRADADPPDRMMGNPFATLADSNLVSVLPKDADWVGATAAAENEFSVSARAGGWVSANLPGVGLAALILLAGGLALRTLRRARAPSRHGDTTRPTSDGLISDAELRAEEAALSEFAAAFRVSSAAVPARAVAASRRNPLWEFLGRTPKLLHEIRKPLQHLAGAADPETRQGALTELLTHLGALKEAAGHPDVLPVWQMVSALEGFIKQLLSKPAAVTASTLRTAAAAVDVLGQLCKPRLPADILTHPPLRMLAVDDDAICLKAVAMALKKTLTPPDLAEHAEAALALAAQHAYDVIFLDVLMPGMDGFEACAKIHETEANRKTPIVFVTTLSDFDARTKASIKGGADFIGKPFLGFEITVKALTFVLRRRLQARAQTGVVVKPASPGIAVKHRDLAKSRAAKNGGADIRPPVNGIAKPQMPDDESDPATGSEALTTAISPSTEPSEAFLKRATEQVGPLRDLVGAIFETPDAHARQQMLAAFSVRLNDLAPAAEPSTGHPAGRLTAAMQALLKQLLQKPSEITSSSLLTIATAVDLIRELCGTRVRPDLAEDPPIRVLAVEDDPVARQAILLALQRTFEKPESADCGEAALTRVKEQIFDVIFMDVQMPGMDGFIACMRIHETELNHATPVVFVTNHNDFKARSQSNVSGGSDFVAKPFLAAEITLKALTFALRGRMMKQKFLDNLAPPSRAKKPKAIRREAVPA